MNKLSLRSVEKTTWVRTAVLFAALVNQALVIFGITKNAVDENSLVSVISYLLTVISSIWSWWKNNSFTEKAQQADGFLNSEPNAKG